MPTDTEEPRWPLRKLRVGALRFLGRAGPLDIWLDPEDRFIPYLVVWGPDTTGKDDTWTRDTARAVMYAQRANVHLTLHDECMIYQLIAAHEETKPQPNQGEAAHD